MPDGDLLALIDHFTRGDQATPGWQLLVIEFRVHAARDAELSGRYAAAHARTVDALAGVLAGFAQNGEGPRRCRAGGPLPGHHRGHRAGAGAGQDGGQWAGRMLR